MANKDQKKRSTNNKPKLSVKEKASSAEFMGEFWLGKVSKCVI